MLLVIDINDIELAVVKTHWGISATVRYKGDLKTRVQVAELEDGDVFSTVYAVAFTLTNVAANGQDMENLLLEHAINRINSLAEDNQEVAS
ncbi:MAG: hypothetical protein LC687_03970 [Actinobacteria bacterium]|nr:hypothetical protein [Actinomycetota bacterium]MCA1806997.1 hypothetical protein [Actinomycetota bacterium]